MPCAVLATSPLQQHWHNNNNNLRHVKSWSALVDRSTFWVRSTTWHFTLERLNPRVRSKVSWIDPTLRIHHHSDIIQQDGRLQEMLVFLYWRHGITTVKYIIDCRWKQTWTDELGREQWNGKSCFFLWVRTRGCKSVGWHWVRTHDGCGGSVLRVRSTTWRHDDDELNTFIQSSPQRPQCPARSFIHSTTVRRSVFCLVWSRFRLWFGLFDGCNVDAIVRRWHGSSNVSGTDFNLIYRQVSVHADHIVDCPWQLLHIHT